MLNFNYYNPVNIVFGQDTIKDLSTLIPKNQKILMTYGGGSIKSNGVYDQVKAALKNHNVVEFAGIEPNPTYQTCMKAAELAKKEQVEFLLAVGGGSVLDGTKFIAAAAKLDMNNDPWQAIMGGEGVMKQPEIKSTIPIGCVITLPATGSEMNCGAVITNRLTSEKIPFGTPLNFPEFSIIDPTTTFSLPKKQVANGIIDTFIHVVEQYITYDVDSPLQDRQSEAILRTLVEEADKILADPPQYNARANFFWCATQGLNGLVSCGVAQDWCIHMIGHELTAFYGIDHGVSLAIVLPEIWRKMKDDKAEKLIQYGSRVFDVKEDNKDKAIELTINKTEDFFAKLGVSLKLSAYGIDAKDAAEKVSQRFTERNTVLGEKQNVTPEVVKEVLLSC